MIHPQELRIGSLISDLAGQTVTVRGITKDGVWIEDSAGPAPANAFNPMPLTEEWLERLGFKDRSGSLKNRMGFGIDIGTLLELCWYVQKNDDEGIRFQTKGSGVTYDTKVKYVHQLQNLYFALTGSELTINE